MKISRKQVLAVAGFCLAASQCMADIVVVGSEGAPELTSVEARQIFLKKVDQFPDGSQVVPVDLTDDSEIKWDFYQKVVGKDRADMFAYWYRANLNRTASQPRQIKTIAELKQYLDKNPDAIAYMDEKDIEPDMHVLLRVAGN